MVRKYGGIENGAILENLATGHKSAREYRMLHMGRRYNMSSSSREFCIIVSETAVKTSRMFDESMASVMLE